MWRVYASETRYLVCDVEASSKEEAEIIAREKDNWHCFDRSEVDILATAEIKKMSVTFRLGGTPNQGIWEVIVDGKGRKGYIGRIQEAEGKWYILNYEDCREVETGFRTKEEAVEEMLRIPRVCETLGIMKGDVHVVKPSL